MGEKRTFFSLKWKVFILILGAVVLTSVISLIVALPVINKKVSKLTENYMLDYAIASSASIDFTIDLIGISTGLNEDNLKEELDGKGIAGTSSSYMYVLSRDGVVLYHPSEGEIGTEVRIPELKEIIADLQNEKHPTSGFFSYKFEGKKKYAAYCVGKKEQHVLVISADKSDVMSCLTQVTARSVMGAVIATVICGVAAFAVIGIIIAPIISTSKDIEKIAALDFSKNTSMSKIPNDETGMMVVALDKLRDQLSDTIRRITNESQELNNAAYNLNKAAEETVSNVGQVEAAIHGIAAGASSQAKDTQEATTEVMSMGDIIEETETDVKMLLVNADEMNSAGTDALDILGKLGEINLRTLSAVAVIDNQTNETNKSVNKIMQAVDIITNIADETNLLALNASIEAARAGEAGKGFAVVASEIQQLAEQSTNSANEIAGIIRQLIIESEKSMETVKEMKYIINEQDQYVNSTEDAFKNVKEGIDKSIEGIERISRQTDKLGDARVKVIDVVQGLTAIAQENAASTEETSAATTEVSNIMLGISKDSERVHEVADSINKDMARMRT